MADQPPPYPPAYPAYPASPYPPAPQQGPYTAPPPAMYPAAAAPPAMYPSPYPPGPQAVAYPPPGAYPPQGVYPPPGAYVPPPQPREPEEGRLLQSATAVAFPKWHARLAAALGGKPVPIISNFEALLAPCPTPKARVDGVRHLVGSNDKHNNGVIETMVAAFELSVLEPAVQRDIAAKIDRIELVSLPVGAKSKDRVIELAGSVMRVVMVFSAGSSGVPQQAQFHEFFEKTFFAEERYLVTRFVHESVPFSMARIGGALGHDVKFNCDIVTELGKCEPQSTRLHCAQTLVSISGQERQITAAAQSFDEALTAAAAATEQALTGKAPPKTGKKSLDVFHSPNFLKPLVLAFEHAAAYDAGAKQAMSQAIAAIHFENIPGKDHRQKGIAIAPAASVPGAVPTSAGIPPFTNGVLVYKAVLGAGSSGLFNQKEIEEFLELHFKCHEKSMITNVLSVETPAAQATLSTLFQRPIVIEFVWGSIFPDALSTKQRLTVADAIWKNRSEHVLQTIVLAMQDLMASPACRAVVQPVIQRIAIQCTPGDASSILPQMYLAPIAGGQVLVYAPVLGRGVRGCLGRLDFRNNVRQLLGIPIPPSEQGIGASVTRVTDEFNKIGQHFFNSKLF